MEEISAKQILKTAWIIGSAVAVIYGVIPTDKVDKILLDEPGRTIRSDKNSSPSIVKLWDWAFCEMDNDGYKITVPAPTTIEDAKGVKSISHPSALSFIEKSTASRLSWIGIQSQSICKFLADNYANTVLTKLRSKPQN